MNLKVIKNTGNQLKCLQFLCNSNMFLHVHKIKLKNKYPASLCVV